MIDKILLGYILSPLFFLSIWGKNFLDWHNEFMVSLNCLLIFCFISILVMTTFNIYHELDFTREVNQ